MAWLEAKSACRSLTLGAATWGCPACYKMPWLLQDALAVTFICGNLIDTCAPERALICPTLQGLWVFHHDCLFDVLCGALWCCGMATTHEPAPPRLPALPLPGRHKAQPGLERLDHPPRLPNLPTQRTPGAKSSCHGGEHGHERVERLRRSRPRGFTLSCYGRDRSGTAAHHDATKRAAHACHSDVC
jgi:hypothetical protein